MTFNYRVGALGFMALDAAGIKGNMALKDTVAVLEWVQQHIPSFGGHRSRVMLFGQSAGADNTFVISTLPRARELLSGVVTESGGGAFIQSFETAQKVGASYAASLNCSSNDVRADSSGAT